MRALAFAPSGQQLVSGGDDGLLRFWSLPGGTVETLEIGLPINQIGFWRDDIWVRAAGDSLFFFDRRHRPVATMIVRQDTVLAFTPDGWFTGPAQASRFIRLYRESGEPLKEAEVRSRLSPQKVLNAITNPRG